MCFAPFLIVQTMVSTNTLRQDFASPRSAISEVLHGTWNWKSGAAAFGLGAGFIAPVCASIATVVSWFTDPVWHHVSLHQAGTTLFFVTLPLLILGAHCLDLIDRDKKLASQRKHATANEKGYGDVSRRESKNGNCH